MFNVIGNPKMLTRSIILTLFSSLFIGCNTTFLNHKDYELKLNDLNWNKKIEDHVGEIYIKDANLLYGRNWDSTFIVLSADNGIALDTLYPYTIANEREGLILDTFREYKNGYSLYNIPIENSKYSRITLKVIDRQYRGDTETFYLIVETVNRQQFKILFNRKEFTFISDIIYFKDGKFIMTYNGESANEYHKYFNYVGLFDLDQIMAKG